ncbi:uncharacterized protein LOC132564455 [Ylistrum balloti]|uniref:uncharacterized protein LOC132564455 n=1 Tax=Ylistrum balloti TaxID=509963 RepID=UPI002905D6F8|nr:uncharacterized protein LOC132564455 [Ylistrum balloti]
MGCTYTKTTEFEKKPQRGRLRALFGRDHKRTKVQIIHIGNSVGVPVGEGTPMINLTRKTEQIVLMQLREEGIIPNKGLGGVAFTVDLNEERSDQTTSNDVYNQLPGVPQYTQNTIKPVSLRPRKLPPLTTRSVKLPPKKREADAEVFRNEALRRKGKMARLSDHRRELAAAKREARQAEKQKRLEAKMMTHPSRENCEMDKVKVDEKLERARINRESKAKERREKICKKMARVIITDHENPNRLSTEEKLERARKNREKRLEGMREKWEKKERKIEAIKRSKSVNKATKSLSKLEI